MSLVVVRAPFRISLFGGGSDYPAWAKAHGGAVLSTTINRYCWISARHLPPYFPGHAHRLVWSKVEEVLDSQSIQHPAIRAVLQHLQWPDSTGLEIHHQGDLPARSGMGSSSAFTVGLLHALHALRGVVVGKERLARDAIHVEQEILKETVGAQDQIAAAYGGLNVIRFPRGSARHDVHPVTISAERAQALEARLQLYYVGPRPAATTGSAVAATYDLAAKSHHLRTMAAMVDEAVTILANGDLDDIGRLLHDAWKMKKELGAVSDPRVDAAVACAYGAGALGVKLLGAGAGGCLLVYASADKELAVFHALQSTLLPIEFCFERNGAQVVLHHVD